MFVSFITTLKYSLWRISLITLLNIWNFKIQIVSLTLHIGSIVFYWTLNIYTQVKSLTLHIGSAPFPNSSAICPNSRSVFLPDDRFVCFDLLSRDRFFKLESNLIFWTTGTSFLHRSVPFVTWEWGIFKIKPNDGMIFLFAWQA